MTGYTVISANITRVDDDLPEEDRGTPIITFHGPVPCRGMRDMLTIIQLTYGEVLYASSSPSEWDCNGTMTLYTRHEKAPPSTIREITAKLAEATLMFTSWAEAADEDDEDEDDE